MPLLKGKSNAVFSHNVGELVSKFKDSGTIGKIHPKSVQQAKRIALAIAYKNKRSS